MGGVKHRAGICQGWAVEFQIIHVKQIKAGGDPRPRYGTLRSGAGRWVCPDG